MQDEFVEAHTSAGTVRGRWQSDNSAAFLGIPFAEPPVGELRFQPPVPKKSWRGTLDALEYGATAQRGDPGVTLIPEPSIPGESTLNVNVFTPDPGPASLPVLVWIHGGGYFAGSPASPWYNGKSFNRDGVVTVTISYRLGFEGFGYIDGVPSNRGVRDWIAALEWVQENISQFGGDPQNVTIAGQSAGGGAVLTLLGMPSAQHLFRNAYSLSSPIPDVSLETAREFTKELAAKVAFESVPESTLLRAQKELLDLSPDKLEGILTSGLTLGPTVDGDLIPRRTLDSIAAGVGSDKPLVAGATDDEFTMAMEDAKLWWVPRPLLLKKLGVKSSKDYLGANADVLRPKSRLAGRIISDRMFRVPLLRLLAARGDAPTWAYRFAWPSKLGYAQHCLDVPFFFDCLTAPSIEPLAGSNPPQEIANILHANAVEFSRSGNPGWPRYVEPTRIVRVFDLPTTNVEDGFASVRPLIKSAESYDSV